MVYHIKIDLLEKELDISKYEVTEEEIILTHENYTAHEILKQVLPNDFDEFPSSYEIIGNIAHLNLREKFNEYKYIIGKIILDVYFYKLEKPCFEDSYQ